MFKCLWIIFYFPLTSGSSFRPVGIWFLLASITAMTGEYAQGIETLFCGIPDLATNRGRHPQNKVSIAWRYLGQIHLAVTLQEKVRQEVVQVIVQHQAWTYCSVNSSLRRRAWLVTVGCEALLTTTLQPKHHRGWVARLTDMSNIGESPHHRYKEMAHGCLRAMPKRQAVRIVRFSFVLHGCCTAGGMADSKSVVSYLCETW